MATAASRGKLKNRVKLLPCLLLLSNLLPVPAQALDVSAHIQTDFSLHFDRSNRAKGNATLPATMLSRDIGFSTRWRAAVTLLTRGTRKFQLLAGPYARLPVLFSFTNYGSQFVGTRSLEIGGDLGVDWLGYARLLFTFAPDWSLVYESSDLNPTQPGFLTEATYRHWSAGFRLEVPLYWLESDPGDRRAEFGLTGTFAFDKIRDVRFRAIDFTPGSGDSSLIGQSFEAGRELSHRWLLGAFMNFRI